ncbi:Dusp2 [Symbiodinium natans]|uniref:Dusp2 protein n=1 Tax=Symbiodinium natans TaxID=878477 RepID=A0A812SJN8_9DINO|nr:Dusp2 [Symbiodinium natans]
MVAPVRLSRARTLATYREVTLAYKSYDTVANTKKERQKAASCRIEAATPAQDCPVRVIGAQTCPFAAMGTCHARVHQMPYDPALDKAIIDRIHAELRQADPYHRPEQQPARLCDWGLYLGGMQDVTDCKKMQELGIRGIANVASSACIYTPRGEVPAQELRMLHIDADDAAGTDYVTMSFVVISRQWSPPYVHQNAIYP